MTKSEKMTAQRVESLTRGGMELFCKILWCAAPPEVQVKYPRFADGDVVIDEKFLDGVKDEDITGFRLALKILFEVDDSFKAADYIRDEGSNTMLVDVSLIACRLGSPGSMGDVECYFLRELDRERAELKSLKKSAALDTPPKWILKYVRRGLARYEHLKELRAPELVIKNEIKMWGGAKDLSLNERATIVLKRMIRSQKSAVASLEGILAELPKGNFTPAMLLLGESLEASAHEFEDVRSGEFFDMKTGRMRTKSGELSEFVRTSKKGGLFFDRDAIGTGYQFFRALLDVLQPTVGRA